jgi:hypothetical protein
MEQACVADNQAREKNQPAIHKLKMLPEVVGLLSRNTVQHSIVDPDTNFLQSVKYFLEPLSDGSLPAYNIQRDLFSALTRLPIEKEALLSSGIGKIVLFYTKSKKPEIGVKRTAERLLGEWSRPILKRSDDFKQRKVATREFDHQYVKFTSAWIFRLIVIVELLNLPFALLVLKLHSNLLHSERGCHSVRLNERDYSLSLLEATEPDWRHPILVIRLHRVVHSIRRKAWILCQDLSELVVWRLSGK